MVVAHATTGEVGSFAADRHALFVNVTDGQQCQLATRSTFRSPVSNTLQVTHGPDC